MFRPELIWPNLKIASGSDHILKTTSGSYLFKKPDPNSTKTTATPSFIITIQNAESLNQIQKTTYNLFISSVEGLNPAYWSRFDFVAGSSHRIISFI